MMLQYTPNEVSGISENLSKLTAKYGFESHPFKIGWYNDRLAHPAFILDYPYDTLAYIIISTPHMFDLAFKPFLVEKTLDGVHDPIDECMVHYLQMFKQSLPDDDCVRMHDFERLHSHRPRILVQTAGHVSGAVRYYQTSDIQQNPFKKGKKAFGVCIHPKFGGWFALRGVLILPNIQVPDLPCLRPPDPLPNDEQRVDLLTRFNTCWQDWTFRDVIPVSARYSEEQKQYFITLPKDRIPLIEKIREDMRIGQHVLL